MKNLSILFFLALLSFGLSTSDPTKNGSDQCILVNCNNDDVCNQQVTGKAQCLELLCIDKKYDYLIEECKKENAPTHCNENMTQEAINIYAICSFSSIIFTALSSLVALLVIVF